MSGASESRAVLGVGRCGEVRRRVYQRLQATRTRRHLFYMSPDPATSVHNHIMRNLLHCMAPINLCSPKASQHHAPCLPRQPPASRGRRLVCSRINSSADSRAAFLSSAAVELAASNAAPRPHMYSQALAAAMTGALLLARRTRTTVLFRCNNSRQLCRLHAHAHPLPPCPSQQVANDHRAR